MLKKTIKTTILAIVMSFTCNSQNSVVSEFPNRANGFLLLNELDYEDVVKWEVETFTTYLNSSNEVVLRSNDKYKLTKPYFYFENYQDNDFDETYYSITGYDSNNDIVVNEGPLNTLEGTVNYSEVLQSWVCHSKTYAYKITLCEPDSDIYPNASGAQMYVNTARPDINTGNPWYYEWVQGGTYWSDFCANADASNYAMTPLNSSTGIGINYQLYYNHPLGNNKIIRRDGVTFADGLYSAAGTNCTGTVWGIAKSLGPWNPGSSPQSSVQTNTTSANFSTTGAIAVVNQNYNQWNDMNKPQLSCYNHSDGSGQTTGGGYLDNGWADAVADIDFENNTFWLDGIVLPWGGVIIWIPNMPDVDQITYSSADNFVSFSPEDLTDENGDINNVSVILSEGLNLLTVQYKGGKIKRVFYELDEPVNYVINASNFLENTVYPNPTTSNSFKMDLTASANLKFTYTLYDYMGNLLHTQFFKMRKDEVFTPSIRLANIPDGLMYHRFTFEDGSVIEKTSMKQ